MTSWKNIQNLRKWLLPSFLLLLMAAVIIIWLWIPAFLISRIVKYTHMQSKGQYELSIAGINIGVFPLTLTFQEVSLTPTRYRLSDKETTKEEILYSFSANEIQMEGINLKLLISENVLSERKIKITRPEVKLAGEKLLQVDSLTIKTGFIKKIWPLFEFVQKVDIKKIEFEDADFDLYSAVGDSNFITRAEKISIDVYDFISSSDMARSQESYFETSDVLVRINDFRNDIGDSLHKLTIDTLYYSLKTTDIRIKGFNLFPYAFQPEKNLFEVYVPEVYIKSQSITRFALSDSLKIGFLEFLEPQIKFFHKNNPAQIKFEDIDEFDLYSLIKSRFIKLDVDSFYLQGANVEIFRQPDTIYYRQRFESIDIILNDFSLDSTSYLNQGKLLHASDLEMRVKGYHLRLEDNEHFFRAGSLFASTYSNRLNVHDIHIHPQNNKSTTARNEINIECKALNIEGVNFLDLYHRRILPTAKIEVTEPNVNLLYNLEKEKQKGKGGSGLLFEVVTDYLQGVYANSVIVTDGKLNIRNSYNETLKGYLESNIEFYLSDFRLDSASLQRRVNFFYASDFDLHFYDYSMRLTDDFHKLEVDTLWVSSFNHRVEIAKIRLQPVHENVGMEMMSSTGHSELFNIFVPRITLKNVDLADAFLNQRVKIADFNISNPKIYFENFASLNEESERQELSDFYELIFSYLEDIEISRFRISDGLLTWINHTRKGRTTSFDNEFSVILENFRLNDSERHKKRLLFSDNFDLTIKDQEFELSDDVHVLKGGKIRFSSSESGIYVKDALLFPLITSEKYNELSTTWQVAIPEIKIEGFDFQKAFYSHKPKIQSLKIINPLFQVYIQKEKAKGLDIKAYSIPMPSIVESLDITELKITNGKAITYTKTGTQHKAMANFSFQLVVPDILLKNNEQNLIQLTSSNVNLSASDFILPVDATHNLRIDSFNFNREKKSIDISNLKFLPDIPDDSKNRFSISAPTIHFYGFDFNSALTENSFKFNNIEVNDPEISIIINKELKEDTLEFLQTLDLYPYVEHLVNSIEVKSLDIQNATLNFNWLRKQLLNNRLNLSFKDIVLSENQPPHNLLNSREFTISATQLSTRSKNQMYAFTADSLMYKSSGHLVSLNNIEIKPVADRKSFPLQTGFQTDVAEATIKYIELRGINEKRWLQDNILDAGSLVIGPADVQIFRNKRFPFDQSQQTEWPQDLIMDMKQPFVFDSVKLKPSRIKYSELLGIFDEPGFVEFTGLTITGDRLSNIKEKTGFPGLFHVNAEAHLMNKALLAARFTFDLNSPEYEHTITGSLGNMSLMPLNNMITKTAPVALESGELTRFEFNIAFNREFAAGELYMAYDNLKIAVLDYSGDEIQKAGLSSFLVNNFKVETQIQNKDNLKPADIYFERDEKRSIINFWWKSIYSGISGIIGI